MARTNHRTSCLNQLEPRTRVMVEQIVVKYDAAYRSGWLSEDTLYKNPYCEGLIEATAFLGPEEFADEGFIRRAIAEYCCEFGYMPSPDHRPTWLSEEMAAVRRVWDAEDVAYLESANPLAASRRKLHDSLRSQGWEIQGGPSAMKNWILTREGREEVFYINVSAHKDAREADYVICNENWSPLQ